MSRISTENIAAAICKVRGMSFSQKELFADEIHRRQPKLLASCLAQSSFGAKPATVEFLLHILFVCYQSMAESGLHWPMITEDEQRRQMERWVGAVKCSEGSTRSDAGRAQAQYVEQHPERALLAFVLSETNQWLRETSGHEREEEADKFVVMASMNLVNCIAGAAVASGIPQ